MMKILRYLALWLVSVLLPAVVLFGFNLPVSEVNLRLSMVLAVVCSTGALYSAHSLSRFPGNHSWATLLPVVVAWYGCASLLLLLFRWPYSVSYLAFSFVFCALFIHFDHWYFETRKVLALAFVPVGRAEHAERIPHANWTRLDRPEDLSSMNVDAVVADLHAPALTTEWQKFLANCTLQHIPVYNLRQVEESLTGRVRIRHMYENDLGSLLPSASYMVIKYLLEVALIVLSLPITLPLMVVTALLIKLGDGGSVFFNQTRVGYRGKPFTMYKFRSMTESKAANTQQTTTVNDARVTAVGRVIRKLRIDELPQFLNVMKGEMSLIGPRAEFKKFADELEQQVLFYQYRHIVKPGITGWAQVTHGYATGADETQIKIEHDFYYIKNFSFGLDFLIVFKTIYTMLTGFGAR